MKQILLLLLLPCFALAQYQGNANQKITLGEQTTADGLVFRGVENDTSLITPRSDTSAYIILDTVNNKFYNYNRTTNVWSLAGGGGGSTLDTATMLLPYWRSGRFSGVLPVANGGTGAGVRTFVDTFSNQTVNGVKTFNNRLISTNAMHFVDTALSIVSFAKKTVQPNGMVEIGSGVLSTKTDFNTGTFPLMVTVDPTGRFVYVANFSSANVSMYVINQTNGTLSTKTDFDTNTNPRSVTVDPTGRFVYVANGGSANVSMYVVNQTNGTLSTKTDFAANTNPFSVAVDPTGRFVYVANRGSNNVSMYVINQTNGTLNTKTDFDTNTQPVSVAVDPTGRFVYVVNYISNNVSMYVINQTNGTLSPKQDFNTGTEPIMVTVDPTGRFVYVANLVSNNVSMYVVNQTNGTLSTKTDFAANTNPFSVAVDPTGRFVYVVNNGSNNVSMYVINQTNGTLSTKQDYNTNSLPRSVTVDPTGRFVYVANSGSNNVSQYFLQGFSAGGAYIAGRLSVGVDSAQTNYRVNIGTTFQQDSLFVGGRVTAVGYTTRSDIDAKENIMPINYGIDEVMELEPVSYNYLKEEGKSLGFIAQDIGLIIPEAISWETPFSVYYQYLIPILTKAIQQQQTLIKSLQNRLLILENK